MGFAEKRAVEKLKSEFVDRQQKHNAKYPHIEVNVDFDTLATHDNVVQISEAKWMTDRILNRITNVLNEISKDQFGAEALNTNLKQIIIKPYTGEKYLKNGILTIESSPNLTEGAWAEPEIIRFIEENL